MTNEERAVIVQLIDDAKSRGVRHLRVGEGPSLVEFTLVTETKPQQHLKPLSRLKAAEG